VLRSLDRTSCTRRRLGTRSRLDTISRTSDGSLAALLSGLLRCCRCGRILSVSYAGGVAARYVCRTPVPTKPGSLCNGIGIRRPDETIARELLLAVQPAAVEAAFMAQDEIQAQLDEKRRALELELQHAEYEVGLAARRYEADDPANRLVATELEARWNAALERLHDCQARLAAPAETQPVSSKEALELLLQLAANLDSAWSSPTTDMRTKQRLVRALIDEIMFDVDAKLGEIRMIIHWRGGQHSEVRVPKLRAGEHGKQTSAEAEQVIRDLANRWSDDEIARALNRMGLPTGTGESWTSQRVASFRIKKKIRKYDSITKNGECLTMNEAAEKLGVTNHVVRRLIRHGILPARQAVYDAPWQIQTADLELTAVQEAVRTRRRRRGRPCRNGADGRTLEIPGVCRKEAE
jgi:hypothetical protein